MTRITHHLSAAIAAILIVTVSFSAVVTVPPAQAQALVIAPNLA